MLKMLTGLAAKIIRLGGTADNSAVEPNLLTDAVLLDWLDSQSSGPVAFRWSTTGRGWRLMEVPGDYPGTLQEGIVTPPSQEVRKAIADAMLMVSPTDTQALDWLDQQSGSYTGKVLWRHSTRGLGWRLHETSRAAATATVRETISAAMQRESAVLACKAAAGPAWLTKKESKDSLRVPEPSRMYCITQTGPETFKCEVMAQDGFERWAETSLDAAVESVIRGADAINHTSITCDNITIQLKDPVNAALCRRCGDIVISKHRHDFVTCGCGGISVDGGHDYGRRVAENLDDVREIPTKALFDRLKELPNGARGSEWKRHNG